MLQPELLVTVVLAQTALDEQEGKELRPQAMLQPVLQPALQPALQPVPVAPVLLPPPPQPVATEPMSPPNTKSEPRINASSFRILREPTCDQLPLVPQELPDVPQLLPPLQTGVPQVTLQFALQLAQLAQPVELQSEPVLAQPVLLPLSPQPVETEPTSPLETTSEPRIRASSFCILVTPFG